MSEELNLAAYPPAVLNALAAVIAERFGPDGYVSLTTRFDAAAHVIETLRSLPVDLRMEAMGMDHVVYDSRCGCDSFDGWREP